jgi:DNA-3-methyladenine glycosylase II
MRRAMAQVSSRSERFVKALAQLRAADPILGALVDKIGPFRMDYKDPVFETLVRSIVYQQLSGQVASVIYRRVLNATGEPLTPERLAAVDFDTLRAAGLSRQKASYVLDAAARASSIGFEQLPNLSTDQVIERLTTVKGVGVWTSHMFLIFALRRPDILPTLDLGVRTAIQKAYELPELPSPKEVERIGSAWRPWCSIASWYLWRSLDIKTVEQEAPKNPSRPPRAVKTRRKS